MYFFLLSFFFFDGENISFDASLVVYVNSTNSPPIMIINRIYENLRQPTLPLSMRINTGSLYRNVSILNYKRDKDNVSCIY